MNHHYPCFKGWAKPGPVPPGATTGALEIDGAETLDAISGYFRIFQLRQGHRFSTDDILTAWYGTSWCPCARAVLDLGSGIGAVGMIAAWRLSGAKFVTVEAQAESVALARRSARYNGLEDRYDIRLGDFRDPASLRAEESFDLVLGSPPYFPAGSGVEGDHPQKIVCRFELRGTIADYCAVAAQHLAPGGFFACVFPTAQLSRVEAAARAACLFGARTALPLPVRNERGEGRGEGRPTADEPAHLEAKRPSSPRPSPPSEGGEGDQPGALNTNSAAGLSIIRRRPVVLREGEAPLLSLFGMMRAADLPEPFRHRTWVEPPLIIRASDGAVHPEYSAVKLSIGFPP
ncbi:MAG TPA: methyltransferase [Verrucomicrobiae bacterium]